MQLHFDQRLNIEQYQYWTPEWAAIELIEKFFPHLNGSDLVLEPSCGLGAFLKAIPGDVPAIGVEIDPNVAEICRQNTGRRVITGDFRSVELPEGITAAIGNPPFAVSTISAFLHRITHLADCRTCGFLLPAYAMQTHNTVERWRVHWSMRAEIIPRRLFPRLRLPLMFVLFQKDRCRNMIGFALYDQAVQVDRMAGFAKEILAHGVPRKNTWRALVDAVLAEFGEANLEEIYAAIEPRRPTPNTWWKEKIRQVCQLHCIRVAPGRYKLAT
jgi:site-specific DNA-methyltransferase (adenine-specific)